MSIVSVRNGDVYISSQDEVGVIAGDYATQSYVNTAISNLIDGAPSNLDTLNEIATALGSAGDVTLTGTQTLTNKSLTSPYIQELKYMGNIGSAFNFQSLAFSTEFDTGLTPNLSASNSTFRISNYKDTANSFINRWELRTGADKNFFAILVNDNTGSMTDDGSHSTLFNLKGSDDIGYITAGSFITGVKYKISTLGTVDWNAAAGTSGVTYSVGDIITAANNGGSDGSGIAVDLRPDAGQWNTFEAFTSTSPTPGPTNLNITGNKIQMYGEYVFPQTDGTSGQVLTTDGSGYLSFEAPETITLATLKSTVAASSDFADFKTRIAAL